jgi:chromosome segregation ATPase
MKITKEGESQEPELNIEELQEKIDKLEKEKNNVVGELIEVRKSRKELQDEIDRLAKEKDEKEKPSIKEEDKQTDISAIVAEQVNKLLSAKQQEEAKANKEKALERFYKKHREFHPDNDSDGAMREKLEKSLGEFRLEGIISESDFSNRVRAAAQLIGVVEKEDESTTNPYSSTRKTSVSPSGETVTLPPHVAKWAKESGRTPERAKQLYEKYPHLVGKEEVDFV